MNSGPSDGPGVGPEAIDNKQVSATAASVASRADIERSREVASRFQDAYAVVVIGKAARRHVFFGLPSAQRAVDRAHARGDFADLVLVKLTPVGEV